MNRSAIRIAMGVVLLLGLTAAGSSVAAELFVGPGETYATIQAAVDDAASAGDVINVAAGVYEEQVLVDGKSLSILGAGPGLTTVRCPASIAVFYSTSYDHYPVVGVQGGEVHLAGLTVDGDGRGDDHQNFLGIDFHDAGGSITDVTVTGVRDTPLSGVEHGIGLYCLQEDGTPRSLVIDGVTVTDYQQNGMALLAAAGSPLDLTVQNGETVGAGPTTVTAQNGIQVGGADIIATLTGNTVRDVAWDGPDWTATGILILDAQATLTGNTLSGCQVGAWFVNAPSTVTGNSVVVPRVADLGIGLVADNHVGGFKAATGGDRRPRPADPGDRRPRAGKATLSYLITGNDIALDPAVVEVPGTLGLWLLNQEGTDDLEFTATGNQFTGFELAVFVNESTPTDGTILAADLSGGSFAACAAGVLNDAPLTVLAEDCWWGAVDGPGGDGPGAGAAVTGNVDYDPWVSEIQNLVLVPDLLTLAEAAPAGTMVAEYTGGASARIYGFSVDVFWDPDVLTAAPDDFTPPPSGAFAGTDFFFAHSMGPGRVRIDATLSGLDPGVYRDPFFQVDFTAAAGAVEGAESAVELELIQVRDGANADVDGVVPAAGLARVDLVPPQVPAVTVTDTTLASVDWTRDGHDIQVDATVIEGALATLACDLSAFGGPVLQLADAAVDGQVYTWTWGPVTGSGDGPAAAVVTATDIAAQSASLSDEITADNTPPAALGGLAVAPGHETIHLAWTEPTADGGAPIEGVVFRASAWGGYPHYAGALPIPPATVGEGEAASSGAQPGSAWDWSVTPRDVYAVAGFVVDLAGNASPQGGTGLATNYWLGDTDGDGYVTVVPDINALGNTYGLTDADPGYDGACDVGPTIDYSPIGVPNPQSDGYQVQFEDLVVFALNFGEVDPSLEAVPSAPPRLRWERLEAATWVLVLADPCPALKAVNLRAELPEGVSCQVTAGALLQAQAAPTFLRNIPAHGLDAGLAVLGRGVGLTGEGELMRVTLDRPLEELAVTVAARDLANQELLVDVGEVTGAPELPRSHRLEQNIPNPFNPATTIAFELPRDERVQLAVYGLDGRLVRTLLDAELTAGRHTVVWQGRDGAGRRMATGTYFYALRAGDFRQVRKMTLMK